MRKALLRRVRPLIDQFVSEITVVVEARIESELVRMGEAIEHALSAFASEAASGDTDRRDHDPVPHVRRSARRGLPGLKPEGREDSSAAPAQAPAPRRGQGERAARLVGAETKSDATTMTSAEVASALGVSAERVRQLDHQLKPTILPSKVGERLFRSYDRTVVAAVAEQRRAQTGTRRVRAETPSRSAAEVEAAHANRLDRITRISQKVPRSGKPPQLGMRARPPLPSAPQANEDDDQDDEIERWPSSRIADETRRAEHVKREGELPVPRSSFVL